MKSYQEPEKSSQKATHNRDESSSERSFHRQDPQNQAHFKCSPEDSKQCLEAACKEWIQEGQWIEDCIDWQDDQEPQLVRNDDPTIVIDAIAKGVGALCVSGFIYGICILVGIA